MLGEYYYGEIISKCVRIFGTLFNNITVKRKTSGTTVSIQKVPLAYAPIKHFIARLNQEARGEEDRPVSIRLPRISFEITGLSPSSGRKLNKLNEIAVYADSSSRNTVKEGVPYTLSFALYILSKNQDDALQIVEQILPVFSPTYIVTAKDILISGSNIDVPLTLTGASPTIEYEGSLESIKNSVYWELTFEMEIKLGGKAATRGVIRDIDIDFINFDAGDFLEEMTIEVDSNEDTNEGIDNIDDDTIT